MNITRKPNTDFCVECRKTTKYVLRRDKIEKTIRDKSYTFDITKAICTKCGEEMSFPGLIDKNVKEIDEQYRAHEHIVTVHDIKNLMSIYNIGKAPLSLALGFGEITITRYLEGQVPSKEYSDIIRKAISSSAYMKECLIANKQKIAETAYKKAMSAVEEIERIFSVSDKMLSVISYIYNRVDEVAPFTLQKLLYFVQGVNLVRSGKPMFKEDCLMRAQGPIFPDAYELFKDFTYNPKDDARFAIIDSHSGKLNEGDKQSVDLVIDTFGVYSGKTLDKIIQSEEPWLDLYKESASDAVTSQKLQKTRLKTYFDLLNDKYDINSKKGINKYIHDATKG